VLRCCGIEVLRCCAGAAAAADGLTGLRGAGGSAPPEGSPDTIHERPYGWVPIQYYSAIVHTLYMRDPISACPITRHDSPHTIHHRPYGWVPVR
jgi:hypothetical protein